MAISIEVAGKSLDAALFHALRQLDKRPDEITYEVLSPEAGQVRVLVTVRGQEAEPQVAPAPAVEPVLAETVPAETAPAETVAEEPVTSEVIAQTAQQVLSELLDTMDVWGDVIIREHGTDSDGMLFATLDVLGEDLGILIGRRGETLRALQFVTRLMMGKRLQTWARVNVDVEHYKARREEVLRGLAERMADRVRANGEPVTLEIMPPNERRIIHMALRENPYVTTKSYGDEGDRKVVLSPIEVE